MIKLLSLIIFVWLNKMLIVWLTEISTMLGSGCGCCISAKCLSTPPDELLYEKYGNHRDEKRLNCSIGES